MDAFKNDLGVDCISREQAKVAIRDKFKDLPSRVEINTILNELPSVTPQLSSELEKNSQKLEKNFGESDCISRADAIRVASGYCHPSNVAKELAKLPSVISQEPTDKNFTKSDIDAIVKAINEGWELRVDEVLDKIRAELHATAEMHEDGDYYLRDEWIDEYFDKYKAEVEPQESEEQEPTTKNYLSEEDILELKHRYGDEVEFVVRDMISGEGKRWE